MQRISKHYVQRVRGYNRLCGACKRVCTCMRRVVAVEVLGCRTMHEKRMMARGSEGDEEERKEMKEKEERKEDDTKTKEQDEEE